MCGSMVDIQVMAEIKRGKKEERKEERKKKEETKDENNVRICYTGRP